MATLSFCLAAVAACGEDSDTCDLGAAVRCEEHSGPIEVRFCQPDETWSDCTPALDCNPLTQEGCDEGRACFGGAAWTFCASAEDYPCEPGQIMIGGLDGVRCRAHCTHDGGDDSIPGAPECQVDEVCYHPDNLPDGVGICGIPDEGV